MIAIGGQRPFASFFQPDVSTVAIRNYYIGVDSISFEGVEYEYMRIPEGQPFIISDLSFELSRHLIIKVILIAN